jgi:anti-sigma B factor antagonist
VDLQLGHHARDGIEVIDVQGEIDIYTAPRLRELLIDLVSTGHCQLVVNLDEVGFLDSAGLGVLVGGLRRVRARDGSLDLVCTQQPILKILKITGLTEVFGIYETADRAIAATKGKERGSWPGSALRPRAPGRHRGGRAGAGRGLQRPATWGMRLPGSRVAGRAGQARGHGLGETGW